MSVEGEEVRLKFYLARAVQAKRIRLGLEEGEQVAVAVAVIVSKLFIVCGYSLEYMFASLFDAVLQTVIDRLAASFGSSILSINDDVCDIIYIGRII